MKSDLLQKLAAIEQKVVLNTTQMTRHYANLGETAQICSKLSLEFSNLVAEFTGIVREIREANSGPNQN